MELAAIQQALTAEKLDGWLFYDFRQSNPIAYNVLSLSKTELYTRRWFYFVPARETPTAIVSAVESKARLPHMARNASIPQTTPAPGHAHSHGILAPQRHPLHVAR